MLKAFHNRMRDDKGFTLIELMVVVLIIAILIAIAIPTFLGMRRRAQDRAAQSDLRNGLTAAKAFFTDDETFTGFVADAAGTTDDAEGIEPSLQWVDGAPAANSRQVGIDDGTGGTTVRLIRHSQSGTYFCVQEVAGVPGFGDGTTAVLAEADCGSAAW